MTYKKGIESLKEYIASLEKDLDKQGRDTFEQVSINERRTTHYILQEILRDFEMKGFELPVTVYADVAGGGYAMMKDAKPSQPFIISEGVELQRRPGVLTASISEQSDNYAFIVSVLVGLAEGIILDYVLKLRDTIAKRIRIGNKTIPIKTDVEEIRKIIREELERAKKEQLDEDQQEE